jgi:DNA polymerase-3 subunit gamma/tau
MKIAAGATILGLGGLAGYAVSSNEAQTAAITPAAAHSKPKVHTEVIRRTRHIRPHPKADAGAAGASPAGAPVAAGSAPASAPVMATAAPAPAPAPSAAPSASASQPISTHSSGGGGQGGGGYDDDEGEHESEDGGEGGDD